MVGHPPKFKEPTSHPVSRIRNSIRAIAGVGLSSVASRLRLTSITKKSIGGMATRSTLNEGKVSDNTPPSGLKFTRPASPNLSSPGSDRSRSPSNPLKVTRPEFLRLPSVELVDDEPVGVQQFLTQLTKSKSFSSELSASKPSRLSKLCLTRISQVSALNQLLNKEITEALVFPFHRPERPRYSTCGQVPASLEQKEVHKRRLGFTTHESTRSILVKRSQISRDISRLNDSCSPKKKVAFAKNKMVLLFTKDH